MADFHMDIKLGGFKFPDHIKTTDERGTVKVTALTAELAGEYWDSLRDSWLAHVERQRAEEMPF